jgi:hypothetical protein
MPTVTQKVLGQAAPAATTLSTLYTVPSATQTTCSTINIVNTNSSADTFRVSVAVAGASNAIDQYLYYDLPISGYNTFQTTLGLTLGATDVVRCYSTNGTCSFSLFGVETA